MKAFAQDQKPELEDELLNKFISISLIMQLTVSLCLNPIKKISFCLYYDRIARCKKDRREARATFH